MTRPFTRSTFAPRSVGSDHAGALVALALTRLLLVVVLCTPRVLAGQNVWVAEVGGCPTGPGNLTAQQAINLAADGDLVLVRGEAASTKLVIDGKAITVVADSAMRLPMGGPTGGLIIRNLAADQQVVVRNFNVLWTADVVNCEGTVWFEDCRIGHPNPPAAQSRPALHVQASPRTVLTRCAVYGSSALGGLAHGLQVDGGSQVFAFDSTFQGGQINTSGPFPPESDGSDAVVVGADSFALLSGGEASGGTGKSHAPCNLVGDGGDGLHLAAQSSTAWLQAVELSGGTTEGCTTTSPGLPLTGPGLALDLGGAVRGLVAPALVNEGEVLDLELSVEPGDQPFLFVSLVADPLLSGGFEGAFLGQFPGVLLALPAGADLVPIPLPADLVGPGEALPLVLQTLVVAPGGDKRSGSASWVEVLDSGLLDELLCTVWVDDDAPGDPGPGDPFVSDPLEHGSLAHPFDSLGEALALTASVASVEVILRDGVYEQDAHPHFADNARVVLRSENGPEACTVRGVSEGIEVAGALPGSEVRGITFEDCTVAIQTGHPEVNHLRIADCVIVDGWYGVRLYGSDDSRIEMVDTSIHDNEQRPLYQAAGELTLERCDIRDNGHTGNGYGAVESLGDLVMRNCTVVRNRNIHGAALRTWGNADVRNCTFALNPDSMFGHEVVVHGESVATFEDCIIWGAAQAVWVRHLATATFERCLIKNGSAGFLVDATATLFDLGAHLAGPPSFQNSGNDDFHLGPNSPAIDAGDPAFVPVPGETDVDGDPRVLGAAVDLGSDERVP